MYFQSYGAVSIIKVKAYWFHVRERGVFGAIFGTLISIGVYFAFDWGRRSFNLTKGRMLPRLLHTIFAPFSPPPGGCDVGGVFHSGGHFDRLGVA
jgi:hypothetical protein